MINVTLPMILTVLNQHRHIVGTCTLLQIIPAESSAIKKNLALARHRGLIRSIHSHGGRGHKSIHQITRKGRRELSHG